MEDESILDFGGDVVSPQSDFNSHHGDFKYYSKACTIIKTEGKLKYCGTTSIGLPVVMDPWETTEP